MDRVSQNCPSCGGELQVTELECSRCGARLSGTFASCPFCRLTKEELNFVLVFMKCRGNIKDVERALGISYPTVRSRLEVLVRRLGLEMGASAAEVLDLLEKGEISADEAVRLIKGRSHERRKA
ncbi:hypothetical protein AMJ40_01995 [candidate division TA06 bacterium DG_26]|uniref:DUF2089 domain-containing protein n=1 Tax=candidate division TA06 bacterium DG_26 TaxID=1703771 RepID=A0A0S7WKW7_UNCT6|nr:MAG: hypothetical protein AMJ40_01995 [candidate division TA06 bacterium DG_26]